MDVLKVLNSLKDKAAQTLREPKKAHDLVQKVQSKYKKKTVPKLAGLKDDMDLALSMLKDFITGKYTKVPWQTLILLVGAFIYFVNPMDLVPDFIPLKGLLDDATVLIYIFGSIRNDLEEYRQWRDSQDMAQD